MTPQPQTRPLTIYALCDPATEAIRYVGRTRLGEQRLISHLRAARWRVPGRNKPLCAWIQTLHSSGQIPIFRILATTDSATAADTECHYIQQYRLAGAALFNVRTEEPPEPGRRVGLLLRLTPELHAALKELAARDQRSLAYVSTEALQRYVKARQRKTAKP